MKWIRGRKWRWSKKRVLGCEAGTSNGTDQNVMIRNFEDQITMRNRIARKQKRIRRSPQKDTGMYNEENKENEVVGNKIEMIEEEEGENELDIKANRVKIEKKKQLMIAEQVDVASLEWPQVIQ